MSLRSSHKIAIVWVAMISSMLSFAQAQGPKLTLEHQMLAAEVGVWDAQSKLWMAPNTEPMISKAVETSSMMAGMWLISEFQGDMGGMTFIGRGQFGYDPIAKKYIGTWIDSMSPYLAVMEGTMDASTKTLTMISKGRDARTGKESTWKMVSKYQDINHRTFEMYAPVPSEEGKWWKMMEISYERRK